MKKMEMTISLRCVIKDEGKWHVASCPDLDVFTQGESLDQAKANLIEALGLFLRSCIERGVLDQVLRECGFMTVGDKSSEVDTFPEDMVDITLPIFAPENSTCHA